LVVYEKLGCRMAKTVSRAPAKSKKTLKLLTKQGYATGSTLGDAQQLGGAWLVQNKKIIFEHREKFKGDFLEFYDIFKALGLSDEDVGKIFVQRPVGESLSLKKFLDDSAERKSASGRHGLSIRRKSISALKKLTNPNKREIRKTPVSQESSPNKRDDDDNKEDHGGANSSDSEDTNNNQNNSNNVSNASGSSGNSLSTSSAANTSPDPEDDDGAAGNFDDKKTPKKKKSGFLGYSNKLKKNSQKRTEKKEEKKDEKEKEKEKEKKDKKEDTPNRKGSLSVKSPQKKT